MDSPTQAAVVALLRLLVQQNKTIDTRTAIIQEQQQVLDVRTNNILIRVSALESRSSARHSAVGVRIRINDWKCPICEKNLQHGESFKGHIRKLLPDNVSDRPKCRLQSSNSQHIALLARFVAEGANWDDSCVLFIQEFYSFTRSAVTASYSDTESFNLVCSWLSAALALDGRPFPRLPLISSSDRSKRRKRFAASGADDSNS